MTHLPLDWSTSESEAIADQIRTRSRLVIRPFDLSRLKTCLAIGVAYSDDRRAAIATGVFMDLSGKPLSADPPLVAEHPSSFPYVPGLFAYREGPAIATLLNALPAMPGLLVTFGQGIAHPRGFGLAAHIGVLASTPSIGITRKRLSGEGPVPELDDTDPAMLRDEQGTTIGIGRRLLPNCSPVYASPGHLVDIATTIAFLDGTSAIRRCLPEALSIAQDEANARR